MTKNEAISKFGEEVVEKARTMYETDAYKVFFLEDCVSELDSALDIEDQENYLNRAKHLISQTKRHPNKSNREAAEIIVSALREIGVNDNGDIVAKTIIARLAHNKLLIYHVDELGCSNGSTTTQESM